MEKTEQVKEMENNEEIIEEVTEKKEEQKTRINYSKVGKVVIRSAAIELGATENYMISLCAGLLFGRKAGLKTMGFIVGCGILTKIARNIDDIIED